MVEIDGQDYWTGQEFFDYLWKLHDKYTDKNGNTDGEKIAKELKWLFI